MSSVVAVPISTDAPLPEAARYRSRSVPPSLAAGMVIAGKYELLRRVGTGAMGEVWAARHATLDEEVAIKLVMKDVDHEDGTSTESRFLLEARVAAALSRKTRHIVNVTDHGVDGELAYLVMELLEGESLDVRLARTGPKSLASVAPIVQQIARGLAVAHAEGVVHRDLKPSNVYVTLDEDGKALVKLLDFGIAKLRASMRQIEVASPRTSAAVAKHATLNGFLLGTPAFMSPEQARGRSRIDHRCDVWALAVITYHLLTGEFPFDAETPDELLRRIQRATSVPIHEHRPDLPPIVHDFFRRAFAVRIEDRFQNALALAGAFEQLEPLAEGRALSLPPPIPSLIIRASAVDLEPASREPLPKQASVIAAGIPTRASTAWKLVAAVVVGGVLLATAVLIGVYIEREPSLVRSTLGATVAPPSPRDEIPPVGPSLAVERDAPKPSSSGTEHAVRPAASAIEATPSAPRATKAIDKGEIF